MITTIARTALLAIGLSAVAAHAQTAADGIAKYREMLQDGNPAELFEMKGEELWKQKRGPKNASLEQCDLGKGPGVIKVLSLNCRATSRTRTGWKTSKAA